LLQVFHLKDGKNFLFPDGFLPFQKKVTLFKFLFIKYKLFFSSQGLTCKENRAFDRISIRSFVHLTEEDCVGVIFCCLYSELVRVNDEFIPYEIFVLLTSCIINRSFHSLGSASGSSSQIPKDLGDACQNIWNAAGNNLRVPSELTVDLDRKNPLFTVIGTGQDKINSEVFTRFGGNYFFTPESFPIELSKMK